MRARFKEQPACGQHILTFLAKDENELFYKRYKTCNIWKFINSQS